ncbi:MAG: lipopolysaccharide heptosyltransferase II [Candidatus Omnitrophota bacterium]
MQKIEKILFITLSNIGDVILTLPVLDTLRENFPHAKITVVSGPRPKELFMDNPIIQRLIIFNKQSKLREKLKLFNELKKENFDLVVDLRNSFFGAFLPAKIKQSIFLNPSKNIKHMRDIHLRKIKNFPPQRLQNQIQRNSLYIKPQDEEYISKILAQNNIKDGDKIIVIAAGARSHIKRWPQDKFAELIQTLIKEFGVRVILVGNKDDAPIAKYITGRLISPIIDLTDKTSLAELACLIEKSSLLITNDSAVLHLGSYLDKPIVAIFGPTDELKYGPWSRVSKVVKKQIYCRPCAKAQCKFGTLKCIEIVQVEDVLTQVRMILANSYKPGGSGLASDSQSHKPQATSRKNNFKRILIVRTDRIGDVLLSTPVIKVLRDNYPHAYIAMIVSPYSKEIVDGNPYLDEVIIYDKDRKHKSWLGSIKFSRNLKKRKFDLALILHPTNRMHLVTYLAGIPRRIGYDQKLGFLLSDKITHTKQFGQKHEIEYNLDLIRYLGLETKDALVFMPLKAESEKWAEELLLKEQVTKKDKLLAIHPGASCPSKIWPNGQFAEVADKLIEKYGFKVFVIAGPKDTALAQNVLENMLHPAVNLGGKTSVSQMASLLKRCNLFISNDSGPVHVGSAVGVPVISIFGRSQKGLSPTRWGPRGLRDKFLHETVGCIECLAHNCKKGFACLRAISVEDVLQAADEILNKK